MEQQIQVLTAVCKKLNNDIETLGAQTAQRGSTFAQLDANQQTHNEQLRVLNTDLQFKLAKVGGIIQKLLADVENITHGLRDTQHTQQEFNRANVQRYQELKNELTALSQRLDRMFNEQQVLLHSFETDTAQALSTADSRSRTFVDELRSQFYQTKSQNDSERERNEQRVHQRLDETKRTVEKYDRLEKRIDEVAHQFDRKTVSLDDQYKRTVSDLNRSNETVEQTVYKRFDEKYQRASTTLEKIKKEMRTCFESLEGSVKTLQRITDGRIKVAEENFDTEIDKLIKFRQLAPNAQVDSCVIPTRNKIFYLSDIVMNLFDSAFASSTLSSYWIGYVRFQRLAVQFDPTYTSRNGIVTEHLLLYFIAYC
ncbi:unnamed protein product [Didymodactylos carnosus]|uniref:Uncharacterized protein n=1 Tax=Didymodactylos carnosus TaxID=1234261 RepID=A0A813P708_9BILA|nr:unnamed protein product [Didymodactylos carnosus]CAF3523101.1 unnamed protein product [Didymodactylos carnosus]